MDNPEKLATQGTKDAENTTQQDVGHHYTQTNTYNVNKTLSLLQTTVTSYHATSEHIPEGPVPIRKL